jgi:hypothetical protein
MARRPGDMGRKRPGNPLGQHAPSFPTPAINSELVQPAVAPHLFGGKVPQAHHGQNPLSQQGDGAGRIDSSAHVSHAILQGNNALVPPAVAPQSSYLFGGTVPQAHHWQNPLFQQGGGAGRIHSCGVVPPPLHGTELAGLVAGRNNLPSQQFQPNGHVIGWPMAQMYGPQQEVPRYPGPQPIGPSGAGAWGQLPLPRPARDSRFMQQLTSAVAPPYGCSNAGALPVGPNRYGATTTWAPHPAGPAYLAGSGMSSSSARTRVLSKPTKSFEEFLRDQGILVPLVADELPVLDNTADACEEAMVTELLRDPAEELGLVDGVDLVMRSAPAPGFRSGGPTRDQLSLGTARVPAEPLFAVATVGGSHHYSRAAATAEAREQRSKKQAEKKVAAAAKARAKKLAGTAPNNTLTLFQK